MQKHSHYSLNASEEKLPPYFQFTPMNRRRKYVSSMPTMLKTSGLRLFGQRGMPIGNRTNSFYAGAIATMSRLGVSRFSPSTAGSSSTPISKIISPTVRESSRSRRHSSTETTHQRLSAIPNLSRFPKKRMSSTASCPISSSPRAQLLAIMVDWISGMARRTPSAPRRA